MIIDVERYPDGRRVHPEPVKDPGRRWRFEAFGDVPGKRRSTRTAGGPWIWSRRS